MFTDRSLVEECYPERQPDARKHDFGYVTVLGGSRIYVGAPVLVGLAAMRSGADLCHLVVPRRSYLSAVKYPDLVSIDLGTDYLSNMTRDGWIALGRSDSLVAGNGLTRRDEVAETLGEVLIEYKEPVVLDADALHLLRDIEIRSEEVVLTPHISEFKAITKENPRTLKERIHYCRELSEDTGFTVILKGPVDVISYEGEVKLNRTGNSYMTTGGTGDVLAGICGSLLARGVEPFKAACCASYLNGRAGEIASRQKNEGTMATDIIEEIPRAIQSSKKLFGLI